MVIAMLLHVSLVFAAGTPFPPLALDAAVAEAASLWAPYGVDVDDDRHDACEAADYERLTVVVVASARVRPAANSPAALGFVTFGVDGRPAPVITIIGDDLLRLVAAAQLFGAREWQWPRTMRELVVGRVLGRVLAHEIGHYLLRSPHHGGDGLMRSLHIADALVAPDHRAFRLSQHERERLAAVVSREANR